MKTKLFLQTFAMVLLFLLLGCRTEFETELGKNIPNKNQNRISFSQFKNETRTKDLKQNFLTLIKNAKISSKENQIPFIFRIDTLNINRLDFDKKTTYSFRAYNIFENPDKRYNLVYFYKNDKWNFSILELLADNKSKPIYDSRFGEIIEAQNTQSGRVCLMAYTSYSYHCTHTGSCASGVCDGCNLCVTETSGYVYADCGGLNGSGDGGSGTGNPGDSGGGPSNASPDPSGYTYDPYIEPNTDYEYVRAVRASNYWQQVGTIGNGASQWANEHPDLYCNILENYLNNYSITNNISNLNFANWAIGFLAENTINGVCNVYWEQFQNWFINGDSLTNELSNEFINDLNNPNIVKPTKRLKNNTLLNCIYNKAKTAPNFQQYLQNFYGNFSTAHLLLDVKPLTNTTANAQTSPPNGYWITITINSNNLNRPSLDIARTFMHEMIHAEMFRILLSLAPTSNGQIDVVELTNMLNSNNYPGIYDYFRRFGLNNMQHEQMAAHYRGIIKNYIKQIDSSITDSQADAMAWVGLQGTVAWNNLGTSGQNNILNIYNAWKNNATHSCP